VQADLEEDTMAKAKKAKKVIVEEAYLDALTSKAELLDKVFGSNNNEAIVTAADFKEYDKICVAFDKSESDTEEYVEPAEPK
jgi:hypothetical protein